LTSLSLSNLFEELKFTWGIKIRDAVTEIMPHILKNVHSLATLSDEYLLKSVAT